MSAGVANAKTTTAVAVRDAYLACQSVSLGFLRRRRDSWFVSSDRVVSGILRFCFPLFLLFCLRLESVAGAPCAVQRIVCRVVSIILSWSDLCAFVFGLLAETGIWVVDGRVTSTSDAALFFLPSFIFCKGGTLGEIGALPDREGQPGCVHPPFLGAGQQAGVVYVRGVRADVEELHPYRHGGAGKCAHMGIAT